MFQILEKEREELLKAKRDEEMQELYAYMQQNRLSASEILEYLHPSSDIIKSLRLPDRTRTTPEHSPPSWTFLPAA